MLFEYTLILDLKVKRGEYADFLRAITPLSVDLLEMVLAEFCDIDITKYYKRKAFREWDEQKMSGTEILRLAQGSYSYFRYGPVYSGALNNILSCSNLAQPKSCKKFITFNSSTINGLLYHI